VCFKIWDAFGRFLGFIDNIKVTNFNAYWGTVDLNHSCIGLCLEFT